MRRFLLDGTVFEQPLTGVAKATLGLYRGLLEKDNHLEITVCHRESLCSALPVAFKAVQLPAATDHQWRTVTLPRYIEKSDYNMVHFPWNGGVPAHLPHHVLTTLTLHDVLPLMIPGYFRNPLQRLSYRWGVHNSLRRADLTITDSEYSRRQIVQAFAPQAPPTVIYPASPLATANTHHGSTPMTLDGTPYFFFCGGYDKRKGIELLLETFLALWRRKEFRIPLWLVGTPREYSTHLAALLRKARTLGAVKELGYVTDAELAHYYRNALALIYPSRYEGFGLPPLEGMALGCPVITYPLTSLPEVCGQAALYIDPANDGSLKELILKVAGHREMHAQWSEMGLQQATKFSWAQSASRFLQAIDECARARG
jgi:alpha-1,3-rhamnosyl/mannosyltransferase